MHPLAAYSRLTFGQVIAASGRPDEAEPHLREALRSRRATLDDDHWLVHNTESVLGGVLTSSGRLDEAETLLRRSHSRLLELLGPDHERTVDARRRLDELDLRRRGGR